MSSQSDPLEIVRERRIQQSRVREIFTPGAPVATRSLLYGRADEISTILEAAATPGFHMVVFGERGIGKSSLANVVSRLVEFGSGLPLTFRKVLTIGCDSTSTCESILTFFYKGLGIPESKFTFAPGEAASLLAPHSALLIVDEFDVMSRKKDVHQIGELIKALGDRSSKTRLMLVGIAETCADLMHAHASTERNVQEVGLKLLEDAEIRQLLIANAAQANLAFAPDVLSRIVDLSAGFPYFAQLLGLHSAQEGVADGAKFVEMKHLKIGLVRAVRNADERLRRGYIEAIQAHNSHMYKLLVHSAATLGREFTTNEWHSMINKMSNRQNLKSKCQMFQRKIVSSDRSKIIMRVRKGTFRFTDPRMKSFVRIQLQSGNHQYE